MICCMVVHVPITFMDKSYLSMTYTTVTGPLFKKFLKEVQQYPGITEFRQGAMKASLGGAWGVFN